MEEKDEAGSSSLSCYRCLLLHEACAASSNSLGFPQSSAGDQSLSRRQIRGVAGSLCGEAVASVFIATSE